jgi:hypothetical protein
LTNSSPVARTFIIVTFTRTISGSVAIRAGELAFVPVVFFAVRFFVENAVAWHYPFPFLTLTLQSRQIGSSFPLRTSRLTARPQMLQVSGFVNPKPLWLGK